MAFGSYNRRIMPNPREVADKLLAARTSSEKKQWEEADAKLIELQTKTTDLLGAITAAYPNGFDPVYLDVGNAVPQSFRDELLDGFSASDHSFHIGVERPGSESMAVFFHRIKGSQPDRTVSLEMVDTVYFTISRQSKTRSTGLADQNLEHKIETSKQYEAALDFIEKLFEKEAEREMNSLR